MRNRLFLIAACTSCLCILQSCFHRHHHNINISVSESGDSYKFSATFPENQTRKVQRLVNNSISPGNLFQSADDYMDITTTLQDKTTFYVKAYPGTLRIKISRSGNSPASYNRIKAMCEEVKNGLKQ